jgi:hypothetical protein
MSIVKASEPEVVMNFTVYDKNALDLIMLGVTENDLVEIREELDDCENYGKNKRIG